jgi:2,4-diketo-3-deoxy-L-fuconate hydrolase
MRIARIDSRLCLLFEDRALDVADASKERFAADADLVFPRWKEFTDWAAKQSPDNAVPVKPHQLGAPLLRPAQVFGIGLNYRAHAEEAGVRETPPSPAVFTKFVSSITGPCDSVRLPSDQVDWEVELVAVIGVEAYEVSEKDAWRHVAGLTVGQDLSERAVQLSGPVP